MPPSPTRVASNPMVWLPATLMSLMGGMPLAAAAADKGPVEQCAAIGPAADRLACYDKAAGRAPSAPVPITAAETEAAPSTSQLAPKDVPAAPARESTVASSSLLSKFWELDPEDKRGTFNFTGYRANYVLPVHYTTRINRSPQSPNQAPVSSPAYKRVEAKFQLSLRTKIAQDVLIDNADVWLGFTQQAMWQIWNGADSKPFRNTDYEPELMYMVPISKNWRGMPLGVQWRFLQLGLAHQSNGQSDPLSRSWNRVYLGTGFERGNWTLTGRVAHRLSEDATTDNNPDLLDYRGRGEFTLGWSSGPAITSLLWRTSLKSSNRGAWQLDWSYPVFRDQPNGLRWYVQGFTGYGETLTDYNFKQTSVGAGVSFMQF